VVAQSPKPGAYVTNAWLFNSTMGKDQTTTPGTTCPTLYDKCVGSLKSPSNQMQETGPTVYCPYPRRLEYLTICWWWPLNNYVLGTLQSPGFQMMYYTLKSGERQWRKKNKYGSWLALVNLWSCLDHAAS